MAVLTVNGAAVKAPSELKVMLTEVGSGGVRSASGALVTDVVAVKRRLSLRWAHLTPAELGALLGELGGAYFTAVYPDPGSGMRTAQFRAGDISCGVLRMDGGQPVWTDVTMEWSER